jgi:hypothetical protein
MHMGSMATIGQKAQSNFKHVIFNNGVHDSVGAQPTDAASETFSFTRIAKACGYRNVKGLFSFFLRLFVNCLFVFEDDEGVDSRGHKRKCKKT